MTVVLDSFDISADRETDQFGVLVDRNRINLWTWEITCPSGTGDNLLEIQVKQLFGAGTDELQVVDVDQAPHYRGPRYIHSDEVDNADNTTLILQYQNLSMFEVARIDFVYTGGGSRTFRVKLRVGT